MVLLDFRILIQRRMKTNNWRRVKYSVFEVDVNYYVCCTVPETSCFNMAVRTDSYPNTRHDRKEFPILIVQFYNLNEFPILSVKLFEDPKNFSFYMLSYTNTLRVFPL